MDALIHFCFLVKEINHLLTFITEQENISQRHGDATIIQTSFYGWGMIIDILFGIRHGWVQIWNYSHIFPLWFFIIVLTNLIVYLLSQSDETLVHDENVQQEWENTSANKVTNSFPFWTYTNVENLEKITVQTFMMIHQWNQI